VGGVSDSSRLQGQDVTAGQIAVKFLIWGMTIALAIAVAIGALLWWNQYR